MPSATRTPMSLMARAAAATSCPAILSRGSQAPHVVGEAGEQDGCHAQHDRHGHLLVAGGDPVHVDVADRHRDEQTQENCDATDVRHRVEVGLARVGAVGDVRRLGPPAHQRRDQERHQERHQEDRRVAVQQVHRGDRRGLQCGAKPIDRLRQRRFGPPLEPEEDHARVSARALRRSRSAARSLMVC